MKQQISKKGWAVLTAITYETANICSSLCPTVGKSGYLGKNMGTYQAYTDISCSIPYQITDCINIFLFKCPFNLNAFWTQSHLYDFYYYYYYSLTPHDRVLHLIIYCTEGILICCQITEFDISFFLHCKKWCKNHSLFTISLRFMILRVLLCVSQLFLFPGWREPVCLIFFHMIVIPYLW